MLARLGEGSLHNLVVKCLQNPVFPHLLRGYHFATSVEKLYRATGQDVAQEMQGN